MDRPSIVFTSLCILLISSISSAANRLSRNSPSVRKITQGPVLAQSDFPELSSEDIPIINVHLIAHSHQDAGWLKTDDEYFWGTKRNVVQGNSRLIHDSVFDELLKDENRKFSFAEIRFFRDWYMHRLDNEMCRSTHSSVSLNFASRGEILLKNSHDSSCTFASQFERLISRNQIEFVNGGWVSNDEATTSFIDILDQYTLGSKFLLQTFGERALAKTGWQIDPFGHSLFQAQAFRKMGFDSYFIGRADAQEIALREYRGELETLTGDVFTNCLFSTFH